MKKIIFKKKIKIAKFSEYFCVPMRLFATVSDIRKFHTFSKSLETAHTASYRFQYHVKIVPTVIVVFRKSVLAKNTRASTFFYRSIFYATPSKYRATPRKNLCEKSRRRSKIGALSSSSRFRCDKTDTRGVKENNIQKTRCAPLKRLRKK